MERSPSTQGRRANSLSTSSTVTAFSRRCSRRSTQPMHGPFTSLLMQRPWNYMTIMILSNTPWISVLLKYVHIYHLFCRVSQPSGCRGLAPSGGGGRDKGGKRNLFGYHLDIFVFCFLPLSFLSPVSWDIFFSALQSRLYNGILSSLWIVRLFKLMSVGLCCTLRRRGAVFHRIQLIVSHFQKLLPAYLLA